MKKGAVVFGFLLLTLTNLALAEDEKPDPQGWKANAGFNGIINTGNSSNLTVGGNGLVSDRIESNKFSLSANGAYGRAEDPATKVSSTNTNNWNTELRYDRYLSDPVSLFGLSHIGADEPAGFDLTYGGAAGFSHEIIRTDPNFFKYEAGFDYTRQNQTTGVDESIYSGRLFVQYKYNFSKDSFFSQDVESLFNVQDGDDIRLNTLSALTFKITEIVGFKAGYSIKFDNVPVPGKVKTDTQTLIGIVANII